ncbi:alpha/beta hydrolase family protein [Marinoscillum furvescens]|uniref:Prolyl oligopeptidase family protein n=1 Tax=Marinoscillum furvescens DSM 4134 TaxID=1122208 RepID=A0A3D9L161_MARFU|nr:prolyl oligopeptidase family serine peptidase [Marinoscillum furvescens]RED95227.1 prolyl oligopeptidase family protein [Marinoscillum furvescens DSM 4134]
MKTAYLTFLLLLACFSSWSQQLLDKKPLDQWSNYPIYPRLIQEDGSWKPQFAYLDSISIFSISYLSDGLNVKGMLISPKAEGTYPCLIYNRGGNREFGALKVAHAAFDLGRLASKGYVVIASQYRGVAGGEGQEEFGGAELNDILALEHILAATPAADTSRIGMYGWSRGGMMTYLALTQSNNIKAAAVGGAIADLQDMIEDRPEMETGVLAELIPDYSTNKEEALAQRSASHWPEQFPKDVPVLILHGTADWRVKPEQSLQLAMKLNQHQVPYRLIMYEGADHGINEFRSEVFDEVHNWFDRYLKNQAPLPNMKPHGK